MRRTFFGSSLTVVAFVLGASSVWAQPAKSAGNALVDALVWGRYDRVDTRAYPADVRIELEGVLERAKAYRSSRKPSGPSPLEGIVNEAHIRYERLLVAFSRDAGQHALAVEYVNRVRPCYEWEGTHECPEAEAVFAMDYLAAHPGSPFHDYLPLLAAHRWLCAAEGYDYEKRPKDAARARQASDDALSMASESPTLLIRIGAEALRSRGRCRT